MSLSIPSRPDKSPSLWCIVPAAGIGQRMQADCPKQYLPLNGKTIIEQVLVTLLEFEPFMGVVVAVNAEDTRWSELSVSRHPALHTVLGGDERCHSVLSALDYLDARAQDTDWVLVHDAARPCIHRDSLQVLVDSLIDSPVGGVLGVPSNDTLKKVRADNTVSHTINRDEIWQAQTPQMFRFALLKDALSQAIASSQMVTDEASAVELAGHLFSMVKGRYDNIKITTPDDLWMAEAILANHESSK